MKNVVNLELKNNNFYEAYNDDAYVVAYIMKYKLISFGNNYVKVGFPSELLNEVISFLKKNKVSYFVNDNPKLRCDYGKYNQYLKFLRKDIPIESSSNLKYKEYFGSFRLYMKVKRKY